ncbi:MAG: hypothetical protein J6K49_05845 [Clostridia bacterium]|nr:hypothetical protein [Clostridia bacterium]MBQ6838654.1 hypothetical protein [Clostridia bacterium]
MYENNNVNNVPQWMIDSKTAATEQNDEVGLIVAKYIGFFRKTGFAEKQIGIMLTSAFLLDLSEVQKRIEAVLSCGEEGEEDKARELCAFLASKGTLFDTSDTDPCEIIEYIKNKYGKEAAFETLVTFPQLLSVWKKETVRDNEKYKIDKAKSEIILSEVASVFPEI